MTVLIIDGQGGRLGQRLVAGVKRAFPRADILAVGTNTSATESMLRAGASQAATGENAVIVACRQADVIIGPLGIALADAMLGEITPAIANAVASSSAYRILIPMNLCGTYVAGVSEATSAIVQDALDHLNALWESKM